MPETKPPGGYTDRICRNCWTSIFWVDGRWTHSGNAWRDEAHPPEPPPLPTAPAV